MEGTIRKLKLIDFVTYDSVECYPCENLNIIIGPNGTGKSTIVSAIMLGLGVKPQLTGRGKKAQEFVKTGKQEARIILELYPNHVIERRIQSDGKSIYKLNNQQVSEKDINKFTDDLNIQVGNLCQFLPQDRVGEFARMNKKELLLNTEKAVGGAKLVELHQKLIDMQSRSQDQGKDLEGMENSLATKKEQNARLDVDITTITEKQNLQLEIEKCNKKLKWVQYQDARIASDEEGKKLGPKQQAVEKAKAALQPLDKKMIELLKNLDSVKEKRKRTRRACDDLENNLKRQSEEVLDQFTRIKHMEKDDKLNADKDEKRVKEIEALTQWIENQKGNIAEMEAADVDKKNQIKSINVDLLNYSRQIESIDQQVAAMRQEANNLRYERDDLQRKVSRVENVQAQNMERLRRSDPNMFQGAQWLLENRHMFKGNVYLPMMVEVNVTSPEYIKYVESCMGRDLNSFATERKDDMNLLTNELRVRQRLSGINVVCTDVNEPRQPELSPQEIRRRGFDGYLDEFITAPEPIKRYLNATANLNRIPVSHRGLTREVQLPDSVIRYYSGDSCCTTNRSRYSNEKITATSGVREGRVLVSQTHTNVDEERNRIAQIDETTRGYAQRLEELAQEKNRINEASAQKRAQKAALGQQQMDLQTAKIALRRKEGQLQEIHTDRQDFLRERNDLTKNIEARVKAAVKTQVSCAALFEKVQKAWIELKKSKLEEFAWRENLKNVERQHRALKEAVDQAENELGLFVAGLEMKKRAARELLAEAKKGTENLRPGEPGFQKYSDMFNTFPGTVEALENLIHEKSALIACKKDVDNSILEDYQRRAREIDQLEKNIKKRQQEILNFKATMTASKEEWLSSLKELVGKISKNFSKYYREIQCSGDVILEPGADEHDYKNYGLSIQVSYRESDPLKELDELTQSGGERAVATALYMISLQELTKVPFRCVDEINQGMDEINERRVYKLLMSITSRENTSQYFLLTPKLLKDIEYSDTCMVHCVFNGPSVLNWKHWNMDNFINRKKREMESD